MAATQFPEWWRRSRRFPFLLPDLGADAVIGSWGPLRATRGVVQMSVAVSVDGQVFIDDGLFPCRMAYVTGLPHHELYRQWELVIAGPGWSAQAQLMALPPDRLRLRMADNDDDHTDLKTAYRAWHP